MTQQTRRIFSPEFKLEDAQLVLDQHYAVKTACEAMAVSESSIDAWIRQQRAERSGKFHPASHIIPK